MTDPLAPHETYQVVVVFDAVDKALKEMLRDHGWEFFPIPSGDDDLPTVGIRAKKERS